MPAHAHVSAPALARQLSPAEVDRIIYDRLAWHGRGKGRCWPGDATLARDLGLAVAVVAESIARQWDRGEIEVEYHGSRRYICLAESPKDNNGTVLASSLKSSCSPSSSSSSSQNFPIKEDFTEHENNLIWTIGWGLAPGEFVHLILPGRVEPIRIGKEPLSYPGQTWTEEAVFEPPSLRVDPIRPNSARTIEINPAPVVAVQARPMPMPTSVQTSSPPPPSPSKPEPSPVPGSSEAALLAQGVAGPIAKSLATEFGAEVIARQVAALDHRRAKDRAGTLVASIRGDWSLPASQAQAEKVAKETVQRSQQVAEMTLANRQRAEEDLRWKDWRVAHAGMEAEIRAGLAPGLDHISAKLAVATEFRRRYEAGPSTR